MLDSDTVTRRGVLVVSLAQWACGGEEASQRLQERSQPVEREKKSDPGKTTETKADAKAEAPTPPVDPGPPVALRLQLKDGTKYRNTTVAMVTLPAVQKPVGYAREEELELAGCKGEGAERSCTLRQRVTKFEGEPPTGKLFEKDESRVRDVASSHELFATGRKGEPTALEGTPTEPALTDALAKVHRFYCVRLPDAPVTVGATWTDTCSTWTGGTVLRREVTWSVKSIDDDPSSGKRAELHAVGKVSTGEGDKERTGTIESILYFFVDAGEPHILRERIVMAAAPGKGLQTTTNLNVQFAHVSGEEAVRTDGQPFPPQPAGQPAAPAEAKAPPSR